jgi:hypothetical protein
VKKEIYFKTILAILLFSIVILVYFKFVKNNELNIINIDKLKKMVVYDINENKYLLSEFIFENDENYILIFEIDNCASCIDKGYFELNDFEKKGKNCIILVVYDRPKELSGYEKNFKSKNVLVINKSEFYKYIKSPYLPLLFSFNNDKINWYKYITF